MGATCDLKVSALLVWFCSQAPKYEGTLEIQL